MMVSRRFDVLRLRFRSLFRRTAVDRELERELRFHLEERIAELRDEGMDEAEARRRALSEFGSPASIAQQCRDTRRVSLPADFVQDVRYAVRTLLAQPVLLTAATISIALGVGANLAIFGLANSLLLSTPHARDPQRLIHIRTGSGSHAPYRIWEGLDESGVLAGVAGHQVEANANWRGPDVALPIAPLVVTPNFFDVVGVPMSLGRSFTAHDVTTSDGRVTVVSHSFWVRRLGSSPSVIGSALVLNGEPYTVLGVTIPRLRSLPGYGIVPDVWLPVSRAVIPDLDAPTGGHLQLVGRLHEGQDRVTAYAALSTVGARIGEEIGHPNAGRIVRISSMGGIEQAREFREIAAFFAVLLVVTVLVLAIACANVAGLLLARGTARRREIAVRLALGAGRSRLVRQLLTEGLVLSAAGTAAGLVLIWAAGGLLSRVRLPVGLPIEFQLTFDTRLAAFAVMLAVMSTVLCALAPAWQSTRPALVPALRDLAPAYAHRRFTLRNALVAGQIAVCVLLLVATLLFVRNLALAHTLSPGFDAERALVAQITFVEGRQGERSRPAVEALAERLAMVPGIEAASFSRGVPLTMYTARIGTDVRIEGRDAPVRVEYESGSVGPDYFRALGIQLLRGRDFDRTDRRGAPLVVVVNQEFVRRYFDELDPIGRHIDLPTDPAPTPARVIGVVADSKYETIGEERRPALYGAYLQRESSDRLVHLIARTARAPQTLVAAVRQMVLDADASAAVTVEPMSAALAFAFLPSRLGAALVGLLGVLGASLAMVGLYGVISFAVARRTSEIGIRLALGAPRGAVVRLVLSDAGLLVGAGLALGLSLAFVLTRPLAAFLVAELPSRDPVSFVGSATLLVATSLLAGWIPARRATRIAPALSLRVE